MLEDTPNFSHDKYLIQIALTLISLISLLWGFWGDDIGIPMSKF